jgi:hypothetical protein
LSLDEQFIKSILAALLNNIIFVLEDLLDLACHRGAAGIEPELAGLVPACAGHCFAKLLRGVGSLDYDLVIGD